MSEQNKALRRQMIEAVWNDQDSIVIDAQSHGSLSHARG